MSSPSRGRHSMSITSGESSSSPRLTCNALNHSHSIITRVDGTYSVLKRNNVDRHLLLKQVLDHARMPLNQIAL